VKPIAEIGHPRILRLLLVGALRWDVMAMIERGSPLASLTPPGWGF